MSARDEDLVSNPQIVGRHQVVTGARGNVQDVLRAAAQMIEHVLESLQARLVRLRLLRREYGVKRRAELRYIVLDLIVRGVGQNYEGNVGCDPRQWFRDVRVRGPRRNCRVDAPCLVIAILDLPTASGALHRAADHVFVRLPGTQHFVASIR